MFFIYPAPCRLPHICLIRLPEVLSIQLARRYLNSNQCTGYETTATAISRTLNILATQQDLQARLRAEILKARADSGATGDLTHDILVDLPLLDAVTREILRLHPPVPMTERE